MNNIYLENNLYFRIWEESEMLSISIINFTIHIMKKSEKESAT